MTSVSALRDKIPKHGNRVFSLKFYNVSQNVPFWHAITLT